MTAETGQTETAEPTALRLILTLGLAGILSGVSLVMAYELTLPMITANKAAALKRAVFKVVPGSDRVQKIVRQADGTWKGVPESDTSEGIYAAYDSNNAFKGFAIANEGPGFQDVIRLLFGYDPKRERIIGMEVLESRETPGLGDKIFKDAAFVANFHDLAVHSESGGPIVAQPHGKKTAAHEVDAITGATISSRAVVRIINAANDRWLKVMPPPEQVPAFQGTAEPSQAKGE
ncbi:MAG: FMN-binding protein [Planctomycetota bacterium]